jgi:hypothetical protein
MTVAEVDKMDWSEFLGWHEYFKILAANQKRQQRKK